ncbi:MAG TPA: hypothetical protein LFV92_05900 [Rickettsia endosymbiont of Ceroptres masudai]|nr:hypothetical protein [Rickettsia endosymbiont of Ceroptres masudai]
MSFPRGILLRRPVKPTVSSRGLTTGSIKTTKNTNNFSIFNWITWSSHGGMTEVKLVHATTPSRVGGNPEKLSYILVKITYLIK